ncbi:DUF429 domain-containing protein [Micromonospora sp. MS34]|uniref:DUF429 domain-containing protein n=1 Tax=Micromonospora sp. MS34 TaxID=3385971 RepID=UPI0039A381FA
MLTVGIDLAAEPRTTAVASVRWTDECATLEALTERADDDALLAALAPADKTGIDCPLGWPAPFVEFLVAHHAGSLVTPELVGREWRRELAWRRTDLLTHHTTGHLPLSVAADRIAHTAMRCAALLAALAARGRPVDRSGAGAVVEVYPAGSLKLWELPHRRYKGTGNGPALGELVDRLTGAAPWLRLGGHEAACRRSDHALDAVVAALAARAAALGRVSRPAPADLPLARVEGWIALPTGPLAELAG